MPKITKKQYRQQKIKPKVEKTKKPMSIMTLILSTATLLGGLGAIFVFYPRISIAPNDPVDILNPFSVSFKITNNSYIPLEDVNVSLGLGQIVTAPAQINPNISPSFESAFSRSEWKNHSLKTDESFTITLSNVFRLGNDINLNGADIGIRVSYKLWFLPIHLTKIQRFIAYKQTNYLFYWYAYPLKSKNKIIFK